MFSLINRLVGVVDDPADTARISARLEGIGIAAEDIVVLFGQEGVELLDSTGGAGWRHWVVRLTQYLIVDQSTEFVLHDAALRDGRALLTARIRDRSLKREAVRVLHEEGAHLISFFGRIQTEEISRWRGPELVRPAFIPRRVDPSS